MARGNVRIYQIWEVRCIVKHFHAVTKRQRICSLKILSEKESNVNKENPVFTKLIGLPENKLGDIHTFRVCGLLNYVEKYQDGNQQLLGNSNMATLCLCMLLINNNLCVAKVHLSSFANRKIVNK